MNAAAIDTQLGAVSRNPSTGELINTYPYQTPQEIEQTLTANAGAFKVWRDTPMTERVACYHRLAMTLRRRFKALAQLITSEMGKTIREARAEVEKCAGALDWFAEHGRASWRMSPLRLRTAIWFMSRSCRSGRFLL